MRNTTIADLIKGIKDMDRTLAKPERKGLSKLRKADLMDLHAEVLNHFLAVTQPEVDAILAEKFYHCDKCGGENVLVASREEHERRHHTATPQTPVGLGGEFDDMEQEQVTTAPATGPTITVVVKVGRKLAMGVIVSTVRRPMAMRNPNLILVRHLTDAGHPRVTLHAPQDVAV